MDQKESKRLSWSPEQEHDVVRTLIEEMACWSFPYCLRRNSRHYGQRPGLWLHQFGNWISGARGSFGTIGFYEISKTTAAAVLKLFNNMPMRFLQPIRKCRGKCCEQFTSIAMLVGVLSRKTFPHVILDMITLISTLPKRLAWFQDIQSKAAASFSENCLITINLF